MSPPLVRLSQLIRLQTAIQAVPYFLVWRQRTPVPNLVPGKNQRKPTQLGIPLDVATFAISPALLRKPKLLRGGRAVQLQEVLLKRLHMLRPEVLEEFDERIEWAGFELGVTRNYLWVSTNLAEQGMTATWGAFPHSDLLLAQVFSKLIQL